MASWQGTGSTALLAVAVALATQIPTTIAAIPDSTTRSVVQVVTLVVVVVCATLVRPRELASVATRVVNSLRPPPATPAPTRIHIRPPPRLDVSRLDGLERYDDGEPTTPTPTTPHETPTAKGPLRKR